MNPSPSWKDRVLNHRVLDRRIGSILAAPFQLRHWRVLRNLRTVAPAGRFFGRYLTQSGHYPWTVTFVTPTRPVTAVLYSRHDLLTASEIFLRQDYGRGNGIGSVLDIGANIGLAALFWLTRSPDVKVVCYEPDQRNIARLRKTLAGFELRYELVEAAVYTSSGTVGFVPEPTGRYGRVSHDTQMRVPAVSISDAIDHACSYFGGPVDLVKLDVEGLEEILVAMIPPDAPVRRVIWETPEGVRTRTLGSVTPQV